MKKSLLFIALALTVMLLVVGCGPKEEVVEEVPVPMPEPAPEPEPVVPGEPDEEGYIAEVEIEAEGCTDTDGGINYETAGVVSDIARGVEEDICSGNRVLSGLLYEEYCDEDGKSARIEYMCPSGVCMDGACVPEGAEAPAEPAEDMDAEAHSDDMEGDAEGDDMEAME